MRGRHRRDGDAHDLLTAALACAERGWHVFPLRPGGKQPALHGEDRCPHSGPCRDTHQGWEQRATTDPRRIQACWRHGAYNIGVACGPSDLVVIDLGTPKGAAAPPPEWAAWVSTTARPCLPACASGRASPGCSRPSASLPWAAAPTSISSPPRGQSSVTPPGGSAGASTPVQRAVTSSLRPALSPGDPMLSFLPPRRRRCRPGWPPASPSRSYLPPPGRCLYARTQLLPVRLGRF